MTSELFSLRSRVALVTGASSGIGLHLASVACRWGAKVAFAARRFELVEAHAKAARAQGGEAIAVCLDVRDVDAIDPALAKVENHFGPVDLLVNNAGVASTIASLDVETDDWRAVIATNLEGPFLVSRQVARALVKAKLTGAIINVASILGLGASPGIAAYCASKAGLVNLTRALASEWARYGIRVNALAPGYLTTDLNRDVLQSPKGADMLEKIPMRRFGSVDELTGPFLLLASEASSFMTGSVVVADGGQTSII